VSRARGGLLAARDVGCARPTGGNHGRTTDAPEQRFNGLNLRATLEVGQEEHGHPRSGVRQAASTTNARWFILRWEGKYV
jgi:hypothetical protein